MTSLPPSPFLVASALSLDVSAAAATSPPAPVAVAAAINSVSPGACKGSLPSGESDPSVMLDCAPGESSSCGGVDGHALEGVELIGKCRNEPAQRPCDGRSEVTTTREAGIESGPQDSISDPVDHPTIPPTPDTADDASASPLFSSADPGACGLDLESDLDALEIELLLVGIPINARTLFTEAIKAI